MVASGNGGRRRAGLVIAGAGALLVAVAALAQDASPTPTIVVPAPDSTQALAITLIAALAPVVIALVKYLVPKIPTVWLPFAAPIAGMLIDVLAQFVGSAGVSPLVAAFAGLAGVGVREAVDQVKQRIKPAPTT